MPLHHYWPINDHDKCRSIKFAVDWGNSHKKKVTNRIIVWSHFSSSKVKKLHFCSQIRSLEVLPSSYIEQLEFLMMELRYQYVAVVWTQ